MKVTTDKEDFVLKVEREEIPAPTLAKVEELRECHGAWHASKSPANRMLPISQFTVIQRGARKGQLSRTCESCRNGSKESYNRHNGKITHVAPVAPITDELPVLGVLQAWRVTMIREVTEVVEAASWLDAGAQFDEPGITIIKVERHG